MKIYLASDHAGFKLKNELFAYLTRNGFDVEDVGAVSLDPKDDYPQFAYAAVTQVLGSTDKDPRAILVCGGGQGMAMAANRVKGIRASVIWDEEEAKMTRLDNDSNVLALPGRILSADKANSIVETWLNTEFSGAQRHRRRIDELDEIYG
jgi:ribose 5-phosphate isomerase B